MTLTVTVTKFDDLREYLTGMMGRAGHHASDVRVTFGLAGAILRRKDDGDETEVRKDGILVRIQGNRYAFSYNHGTQSIDMRRDNVRGPTLHSFTNSTPLAQIMAVFKAL
jgi:hypothetical protein